MAQAPGGTAEPDVPEQPDQRTETPTETGSKLGGGNYADTDAADAIESVLPGSDDESDGDSTGAGAG